MASTSRFYALGIWGPPLVVMAVIFALSAMPAGDTDHPWFVILLRKIAHFSEYAVLVACWWRALRTVTDPTRALAAAYLVTVAYAASDEFHQTFVDGRTGTPRDVLIDATGAAVAAGLIYAVTRRRSRERAEA
jgi:VanZ family protein